MDVLAICIHFLESAVHDIVAAAASEKLALSIFEADLSLYCLCHFCFLLCPLAAQLKLLKTY